MTTPEELAAETAAKAAAEADAKKADDGEKSYNKAEHEAAVEAAIAKRFKNAPTAEELKALREKAAKADELEAANLTAQELAEKRATDAEARATAAEDKATAAELSAHKAAIGAELGIPASLRSRLSGTTEEEIRADAVAVAADLKIPTPAIGGPTNPASPGAVEDPFLAVLNKP